jgi:hypothetical protein
MNSMKPKNVSLLELIALAFNSEPKRKISNGLNTKRRLRLTQHQRKQLNALKNACKDKAIARRCGCVLAWADGERWSDIRQQFKCGNSFISKWTKEYRSSGLEGLTSSRTKVLAMFHSSRSKIEVLEEARSHCAYACVIFMDGVRLV